MLIEKMQPILSRLGYAVFWLALVVLATLTAFQLHGTLIAIAVVLIENPSTRPPGWTTNTIFAFSRFLWLVLGILWLGWVMFTEGYLREGYERQLLKKRTIRLALILAAIYAYCLLMLYILR